MTCHTCASATPLLCSTRLPTTERSATDLSERVVACGRGTRRRVRPRRMVQRRRVPRPRRIREARTRWREASVRRETSRRPEGGPRGMLQWRRGALAATATHAASLATVRVWHHRWRQRAAGPCPLHGRWAVAVVVVRRRATELRWRCVAWWRTSSTAAVHVAVHAGDGAKVGTPTGTTRSLAGCDRCQQGTYKGEPGREPIVLLA